MEILRKILDPEKVKEDDRKPLQILFDRYIENTLDYLKKNAKYLIPMVAIS